MTRPPSWTALDRARADAGELLSRHEGGLSFEELRAFRGRFPAFCSELFGIELTPQQLEGARALETSRQVLIRGANAVGKDTLVALWALHEVYALDALAILSGPTDRQVREIMMRREVGRLWRRSREKLPGERYEMAIRIPGREEGGLLAFTASDPERFVGHHSALGRVFVAVTEAQALPAELFEAAQRCQPAVFLAVLNPTTPACAAHGLSKSRSWTSLRWSALDHPNVVEGEVVIPGAVTREWVDAMRREHGEASRFWRVAVLAEWPEQAAQALVRLELLDAAADTERAAEYEREVSVRPGTRADWRGRPVRATSAVVAVDWAREGADLTAIAARRGAMLWSLARWRETDTVENVRRVVAFVARLIREGVGVTHIVDDEVALGGGPHDMLIREVRGLTWRELDAGMIPDIRTRHPQLEGFKSSRKAPASTRFVDTRAQAFWHVRDEFEGGRVAFRRGLDPGLLEELREELAVHEYHHEGDDRIRVNPKDEIRRQLGRSPDLADAFAMTYANELEAEPERRRRVRWR